VWCGGIDDQRILISAPARPHRRSPLAARRGGNSSGTGGVKLGTALHIHWLATLCSHNWHFVSSTIVRRWVFSPSRRENQL
jgi:hypothetical protein